MREIRFVAVGDWGKRTVQQDEIATCISRVHADGVLALGDNFYEFGVESVEDPLWDSVFLDVYRPMKTPWFPVLGNHDYMKNPMAQIGFSQKCPLWRFPNRYYDQKFYWGSGQHQGVHLIAIDSFDLAPQESFQMCNVANVPDILKRLDTEKQMQWLESTLSQSRLKYKIVMGHYPLFSSGITHGNCPEMIHRLQHIFDKHKVDVYLSGHDHCLDLQTHNHTKYIVSGTGSMLSSCQHPILNGKTGVCEIICSDSTLCIRFISRDGNVLLTDQ